MIVVHGVNIALTKKKVIYALPILFGIGLPFAKKVCKELGFAPNMRLDQLSEVEQLELTAKLKSDYRLETNLRELVKGYVQRYIDCGCIRGLRHKNRLPVRGQRTHSNGKTPRRVVMGLAVKR